MDQQPARSLIDKWNMLCFTISITLDSKKLGNLTIRFDAVLFCLAWLVMILNMLSYAWVGDDAYVTFRVVDNIVHGYGLRWNTDERVQAFTNPLWMFLHLPFYYFYRNIFIVTMALSAICTVLAICLLMKSRKADLTSRVLLVLLPLYLSCSFDNFAMCGLEVPLLCCTVSAFLYVASRKLQHMYLLFLIASFCILTRFDSVVLLSPFLVWLGVANWKKLAIRKVFLAWLPLIAWIVFCLFYYGFIFPNTKYAKLHTGIPLYDYLRQGDAYVRMFFLFDMMGFVTVLLAIIMGLWRFQELLRLRPNCGLPMPVSQLTGLGILLSVLYAVLVGGDFMAGRFFVLSFFASVFVIYNEIAPVYDKFWKQIVAGGLAVFLVGTYFVRPIFNATERFGIVDERLFYYPRDALFPGSLFSPSMEVGFNNGSWKDIIDEHNLCDNSNSRLVVVENNIGIKGYYAGPEVTIIDTFGLSEPLLARMHVIDNKLIRIGHFQRAVPPGYIHARETGDTSQMPYKTRWYYEKLRLVTAGKLWNLERLKTIMGFQLGWYDDLLND